MRKLLFAFTSLGLTLAGCADNSTDDNDNGGDVGGGDDNGGDGDGSGSGSGSGSGDGTDVSALDLEQDNLDMATALGAHVALGDLAAMADAIHMTYGRAPAGFTASVRGVDTVYDGVRGGLVVNYAINCRDLADVPQPCNGTQDHSHVSVAYSGSLSAGAMSVNGIDRVIDDWTVRNVVTPTPRVGGDGTNAFDVSLPTGDYKVIIADTLDRVRFNPDPTLPLSGAIDLRLTVERTRAGASPATRTFDATVRLTFSGGDAATITIDGSANYQLTVSTGAVVKL